MKRSYGFTVLLWVSLLVSLRAPARPNADTESVVPVHPLKKPAGRPSPTWETKRPPFTIPARAIHSTRRELRLKETQKTQFMG